MKKKYKVDYWWGKNPDYYSAFYKHWWWPFWIRCVEGTRGMCHTKEEARKQAESHAKRDNYIDLGWM